MPTTGADPSWCGQFAPWGLQLEVTGFRSCARRTCISFVAIPPPIQPCLYWTEKGVAEKLTLQPDTFSAH